MLNKFILFSIKSISWEHAHFCKNYLFSFWCFLKFIYNGRLLFIIILWTIKVILALHISHNPLCGLFNVKRQKFVLLFNKIKINSSHPLNKVKSGVLNTDSPVHKNKSPVPVTLKVPCQHNRPKTLLYRKRTLIITF